MNLYWSVYKNLEKELVNLANIIHFDDKQEKVYSVHIADLLIRSAVEIEALSKHLYEINGGNMTPTDDQGNPRSLFFDSDCINELDLKWHITKKVVNVVASNFYFEKEENLVLRPLKNCNKQGRGRWKKAYQAVKHNRVEALEAGNIGNLVRAMAALYLLNVYNKDEKIDDLELGATEYDTSLGSEVFSVNVYKATSLSMSEHMDDSNIIDGLNCGPDRSLDATVLIDRYTQYSFLEMHKNHLADAAMTDQNASNSRELKEFLSRHPEYADKTLNEVCIACGEENERIRLGLSSDDINISDENKELIQKAGHRMVMSIFSFSNSLQGEKAKRELVLNKLQPIYPSV